MSWIPPGEQIFYSGHFNGIFLKYVTAMNGRDYLTGCSQWCVLEDKYLASRRLEDTIFWPGPWPRILRPWPWLRLWYKGLGLVNFKAKAKTNVQSTAAAVWRMIITWSWTLADQLPGSRRHLLLPPTLTRCLCSIHRRVRWTSHQPSGRHSGTTVASRMCAHWCRRFSAFQQPQLLWSECSAMEGFSCALAEPGWVLQCWPIWFLPSATGV